MTRTGLLIAIVMVAGFFSAFLVNDAICLVLAPLVIETVKSQRSWIRTVFGRGGDGFQCRQRRHNHWKSCRTS